jgi:hypothetical protein
VFLLSLFLVLEKKDFPPEDCLDLSLADMMGGRNDVDVLIGVWGSSVSPRPAHFRPQSFSVSFALLWRANLSSGLREPGMMGELSGQTQLA